MSSGPIKLDAPQLQAAIVSGQTRFVVVAGGKEHALAVVDPEGAPVRREPGPMDLSRIAELERQFNALRDNAALSGAAEAMAAAAEMMAALAQGQKALAEQMAKVTALLEAEVVPVYGKDGRIISARRKTS